MKRLVTVLLLSMQAALGACGALRGSDSMVLRRYTSQTRVMEDTPRVKITVFALPVPAPAAAERGITNLSPDAQAELVKVMATRTPDGGPQGLAEALAIPIQGTSSTPSFRDLTRISRRLVFSLENQSAGAADRISEARIYVRPADSTRFVSWNRIENDYQTVELGKLNLTQERSSGAELGLTLPVLAATPSVKASAGSTLQEEMMLRQQRTALTGAITAGHAMLLQQGGIGIDLTGNVTADFDLVVPRGDERTVFVAPTLPDSCAQRPTFNRQTIRYPAARTIGADTLPLPVKLNVELRYVRRVVQRGHETMMEGDDHVVFKEGVDRVDSVVVVPGEMLRAAVSEIRLNDTTVWIEGATQSGTIDRVAPLQFARFEDAAAMLAWMRRCEVGAVQHPLFAGLRPLSGKDALRMNIWRVPLNYGAPREEPRARR